MLTNRFIVLHMLTMTLLRMISVVYVVFLYRRMVHLHREWNWRKLIQPIPMPTVSVAVGSYKPSRVIHMLVYTLFILSTNNFPLFLVNAGLIDEVAMFVKALTAHHTLQREFIEVVKKPRRALIQLSQEVRPCIIEPIAAKVNEIIALLYTSLYSCRPDRRG